MLLGQKAWALKKYKNIHNGLFSKAGDHSSKRGEHSYRAKLLGMGLPRYFLNGLSSFSATEIAFVLHPIPLIMFSSLSLILSLSLKYFWASLGAQTVKNLPAMQETWIQSLG